MSLAYLSKICVHLYLLQDRHDEALQYLKRRRLSPGGGGQIKFQSSFFSFMPEIFYIFLVSIKMYDLIKLITSMKFRKMSQNFF